MSASDDHPDDDRLTQLEAKLAYLEHTVDVLAAELETQQGETRSLHRKMNGLQDQLDSLQRDTGITGQQDEPPPHY